MSIEAELGQYILQTRKFKKTEDSMGEFECPPLGAQMGLPKATARVDSRLN